MSSYMPTTHLPVNPQEAPGEGLGGPSPVGMCAVLKQEGEQGEIQGLDQDPP